MELSRWERGASGVFRRVCKGWRDAHDQCVRDLSLNARLSANSRRLNSALMLSRFMLRFQRAKQIIVRGDPLYYPDIADVGFGADKWLRALAGLTALTDLNLQQCEQVSDDGLRALIGLTALTDLELGGCYHVSDNGLRALGSLTALTTLSLAGCEECQTTGCGRWPGSPP